MSWNCLVQTFEQENAQTTCKNVEKKKRKKKKKKTCERFLNTFNRWYENKEKTNVLLVL